jgi:hypothetical protein
LRIHRFLNLLVNNIHQHLFTKPIYRYYTD